MLSSKESSVQKSPSQQGTGKSGILMEHKNAAGGRLYPFSPNVGFYRDGYCRVTGEDAGNHSVAATLSQSFLDFSAARGNNLSRAGVKAGSKWCLCAGRWQEALDAFKQGKLGQDGVPRVHLHASDAKALDVVHYADLVRFKAAGEFDSKTVRDPTNRPGDAVKEGRMSQTMLQDNRPQGRRE